MVLYCPIPPDLPLCCLSCSGKPLHLNTANILLFQAPSSPWTSFPLGSSVAEQLPIFSFLGSSLGRFPPRDHEWDSVALFSLFVTQAPRAGAYFGNSPPVRNGVASPGIFFDKWQRCCLNLALASGGNGVAPTSASVACLDHPSTTDSYC